MFAWLPCRFACCLPFLPFLARLACRLACGLVAVAVARLSCPRLTLAVWLVFVPLACLRGLTLTVVRLACVGCPEGFFLGFWAGCSSLVGCRLVVACFRLPEGCFCRAACVLV